MCLNINRIVASLASFTLQIHRCYAICLVSLEDEIIGQGVVVKQDRQDFMMDTHNNFIRASSGEDAPTLPYSGRLTVINFPYKGEY